MNFILKNGMKYTRWFISTAFAIAACVLSVSSVRAQLPPIPGVTVDPPQLNNPSAFLSDWQSRASTATVIVRNSTNKGFASKIWVEFVLNGSVVAYTQPAKLFFTQIQPGINQFNGEVLAPLNTVHFNNNVDQSSQRAGRVPDGQICIIVHVLNPSTGQESVSPNGCNIILSYTPPTLILPGDGSELCKLGNNNVNYKRDGSPMPMFQWTPIVPAPQSPVIYHFAIYEILPNQSPIAAFQGARPLFTQDLPGMTNLLWPVQYFLPEKGKRYVWSVQARDEKGNPFVLSNNGWATPYTFTVGSDCDVNGISGILISPQVLDFGSVKVNSGPVTRQITLQNIGNEPVTLQLPTLVNGAQFGFSLSAPPTTPIIAPATSATFDVTFKPTQVGFCDGSVRIASDAGTSKVQLKGQGVDATSVTIKVTFPAGGENLTAGSQFKIQFSASDNDALSNFTIHLSTDGGTNFLTTITPSDHSDVKPPVTLWDIPSDLQISQGIIKITATDKSGNTITGLSGLFSIGGSGAGTGSNTSPGQNPNSATTNIVDTYLQNRDQSSFTFVPLAFELLSKTGSPIDFPMDGPAGADQREGNNKPSDKKFSVETPINMGKFEIPPDLLSHDHANVTGDGILISGADGGVLDGSAMRYAVQYHETDLNFITPGKGTATSKDASGAPLSASIIYPENAAFVDGESFLHPPEPPPAPDGAGSSNNTNGGLMTIRIASLGSSPEPPITAYFNPKEITIDKSVPWQKHKNTEGDAPTLEFTAGEPASLNVELMFDGFEEKKSVKPDLQRFLGMLGIADEVHSDKLGRVKVQFHWDRGGREFNELDDLSIKYTMFLPDGTPCRATAQLRLKMRDSIPPSERWHSVMTPGSHHQALFFSTDIGPQTLQYLQGNQFGTEPLLHDPVFADQERMIRSALVKNLPLISNANVTFSRDKLKGTTKTQGDFNLAHKFTVEIDGVMVGGIHRVDGLEHEHEVLEYQDADSKNSHARPGHPKRGSFTLTRDWGNTGEWHDWSNSAKDGKVERKSISIIFHNDAGEEAGRMNFFDCFPTRYEEPSSDAKNSGHAIERIVLNYEDLDLLPAVRRFSGDIKTMTGSMSQAGQQMTMLMPTTIGGQKAEILLIGLLMPPLSTTPAAPNTNDKTDVNGDLNGWKWNALVPANSQQDLGQGGTGSLDVNGDGRSYTSGNFQLDLDGVSAGMIQNLEGGGVIGDVSSGKPAPITLDIVPTGKALYDWIQASWSKKYKRKDGAIIAADYDRNVRSTREFFNALITEVSIPACDGSSKDPGYLTIKFEVEKLRFKKDSGKVGNPINVKQKMWLPANFRLKIEGLDCSKVNKIEALTVKQKIQEENNGNARDVTKHPAKIEIPNLKIEMPASVGKPFYDWHEDFLRGNKKGKHASLEYLNSNGDSLIQFDLDLVPDNITPEKLSALSGPIVVILHMPPPSQ